MTLIIYAKCADASILISDRQEVSGTSVVQAVIKYHIPKDSSYIMAFSAKAGQEVDRFYTRLQINPINLSQFVRDLSRTVKEDRLAIDLHGEEGCFVVYQNNEIICYNLTLFSTEIAVIQWDEDWKCVGDENAKAAGNVLMNKANISKDNWQKAAQKIIAIMHNISHRISSVGKIQILGFDVFIMKNNGELLPHKYTNYTKPDIAIKFDYEHVAVFENLFTKWSGP